MKADILKATHQYVRGEIPRAEVIKKAGNYYKLNTYHEEGIISSLFSHLFEDPEDNELSVTRKAIMRILNNYLERKMTLEEAELWFWDVLHLNIDGPEQEEELISYLLYLYDNLAINGITGKETEEVLGILENVSDSERARRKIKEIFERKSSYKT